MERCLWRLGLYEKELDEETIEWILAEIQSQNSPYSGTINQL